MTAEKIRVLLAKIDNEIADLMIQDEEDRLQQEVYIQNRMNPDWWAHYRAAKHDLRVKLERQRAKLEKELERLIKQELEADNG